MVETMKVLPVRFGNVDVMTLMDEHGDRWVTVQSMVAGLGLIEFSTDYPVRSRYLAGTRLPVIPVSMISKLIPSKVAAAMQRKLESEWLFFLGYIQGPKGEGASRKANRESLHLLKKAIKLVALLQEKMGYKPVDIDEFLKDTLYSEMMGIMGYSQQVDWEDLSQWELQNLTFTQNAYASSILLYLSQEELHQSLSPEDCLLVLLNNVKWELHKTLNSMFMAQELAVKLGDILEFESKY